MMKTGSSAIQSFLFQNQKLLKKHNLLYPKVAIHAGNWLALSLLNKPLPIVHCKKKLTSSELYKELFEEIEKSREENILISSESFFLISADKFLGKLAPVKLQELLPRNEYSIKIIIYLRRQDEFIESFYKQTIKTHDITSYYTKSFSEFLNEYEDLLNYQKKIEQWESVFGRDNIIVKSYEKNQFLEKEIYEDFLTTFDISLKSDKTFILPKGSINKSLGRKGTEFMKIANSFNIKKETSRLNYQLVEILFQTLEKDEKKLEKLSFLSEIEREKIISEAKHTNREVAVKYLKEKNGKLFSKPDSISRKPKEENDNQLTLLEVMRVTVEIWNQLQLKIEEKEGEINHLKNKLSLFNKARRVGIRFITGIKKKFKFIKLIIKTILN